MDAVKQIYDHYCSGKSGTKVADMLTIYIEEAHAIDEWRLPDSDVEAKDKAFIKAHKTMKDRLEAANLFVKNRGINCPVVCDSMEGDMVAKYDAWPERLYIIVDGSVVYKGGIGPFDYKIWEVQEFLENLYGKRFPSLRK